MWNPIDASGQSLHSSRSGHGGIATQAPTTTESHLCLLPDQLGIFIRYLTLIILTLLAIIIRATLTPFLHLTPFSGSIHPSETDVSLLPTTKQDVKRREEDAEGHRSSNSSTSSTSSNNKQNLAPRSSAARTRSVSPAKGYGLPSNQVRFDTPPLINTAPSYSNSTWGSDDLGKDKTTATGAGKGRNMSAVQVIWREASRSIWRVAWIVILVYLYLIYYG
jgi:hypothetical protein